MMKLEDIVKLGMLIEELQEMLHALIRDRVIEFYNLKALDASIRVNIVITPRNYAKNLWRKNHVKALTKNKAKH